MAAREIFSSPIRQIVECEGLTVLTSGSQEAEWLTGGAEKDETQKTWTKDPVGMLDPNLSLYVQIISGTTAIRARWIVESGGSVEN